MASRPAPTTRSSAAANELLQKPPCKIHSLAVVADKAHFTGTHLIEIGENTIVHPCARIRSEKGKVIIGADCVVWENAVVGVADGGGDVVIEDGVNIEAGAVVEASRVGEGSTIEVLATVGKAILGSHCQIAPMERVEANESLPDYSVVFANNQRRLDSTMMQAPDMREAKQKNQRVHIALLKKLIPNASAKWG